MNLLFFHLFISGAKPILLIALQDTNQATEPWYMLVLSSPIWWIGLGIVVFFLLWRWHEQRTTDIISPSLHMQWENKEETLDNIFNFVVQYSYNSIAWYQKRRRVKRVVGVGLRAGAIFLTAFAGLLPILDNVFTIAIKPEWLTIALAIAALLLTYDHFGGFTSGWIRYMIAQQHIERLQHQFIMDWEIWRAKINPSENMSAAEPLRLARDFLVAVDTVINDETQEWATEFRSALREIEKAAKKAREVEPFGAIDVTVTNHEQVEIWRLEIDNAEQGQYKSRRVTIPRVLPGLHTIRIVGKRGAEELSDEASVRVIASSAETAQMTLS